jgi:hypothetical protein
MRIIYCWLVKSKNRQFMDGPIDSWCIKYFYLVFFDLLTVDKAKTPYFTTEFGIDVAVVYSLFAFYFWTRRKEAENV